MNNKCRWQGAQRLQGMTYPSDEPLLCRLEELALSLTDDTKKEFITLSVIETEQQYEAVKKFRVSAYDAMDIPYTRFLINDDGSDSHDDRSIIFAAWLGHRVIATIRLTAWPFEICSYLEDSRVSRVMAPDWKNESLEFSRLVVSKSERVRNLGRVISAYAVFYAAIYSKYKRYVGYAKPAIKKSVLHFEFDDNNIIFLIPNRGRQEYLFLSGSFDSDLMAVAKLHPDISSHIFMREKNEI